MKWAMPVSVGLGSAASMIMLLLQTPQAVMSARCAVTAMSSAIVIVFALVLAGASADSVAMMRKRTRGLVDALPVIQQRLTQIDPELAARRWQPVDHPERTALVYELPMGEPARLADQADAAAYSLSQRCMSQASDAGDAGRLDRLFDQTEVLRRWLAQDAGPAAGDTPSLLEAKTAYEEVRQC